MINTQKVEAIATGYANITCDIIAAKIAEAQARGLTEDQIVSGIKASFIAFLNGEG